MNTYLIADTMTLTGRSMRHVTRSADTIITTAVMPIAIMLLFVYVFGGAISPGEDRGKYVDYMLPGVLVMTIAMGVSYTAARLFGDMKEGIVDRFTSLPIARSAALWAQVLTSIAANAASVIVVVAVALVMGFRPSADLPQWLAAVGLLALLTLALTWVAAIAGIAAKTLTGATAFSYPLIFLPFVSSAFVTTDSMPRGLRWFADHQPVTAVVDSLRNLFAGQPAGDGIWTSVAWGVGITVVAYLVANLLYRSKIS